MAQNSRNAYRNELIAQVEALFPTTAFREMSLHGNQQWRPNLLLRVSLIMWWVPGNTLEERFSTARRIVKFIKPRGKVPVAFCGFLDAQERYEVPLPQRLAKAEVDKYQRRRPKTKRPWPRKKTQRPPGTPTALRGTEQARTSPRHGHPAQTFHINSPHINFPPSCVAGRC